jgi:predicted double-glycine peptidase
MLQAWPSRSKKNYKNDWKDGHWVVAIGYDAKGVYFEDPSLAAIRGFLNYKDLKVRWHDQAGSGKEKRYIDHYGLAIWKPRQKRPAYASRARYIP